MLKELPKNYIQYFLRFLYESDDAHFKMLFGTARLISKMWRDISYRCIHTLKAMGTGKGRLIESTITDEDLKPFKYLRILCAFSSTKISDKGLKYVSNIKELHAGYGNRYPNRLISDEGLKYLSNLESLNICLNTAITNEGLKAVSGTLKKLILDSNYKIKDKGLKHLTNLVDLSIDGNKNITDEGIKGLTQLKKLSIRYWYVRITDKGLQNLTNLEELNINQNCNITDKGLKNLKSLKYLSMKGFHPCITEEGLAQLPENCMVLN